MLGAIIGDIIGSVHEFKRPATKEKDFGPLFVDKSTFTDDSVCTAAIADWILSGAKDDLTDILREYCLNYMGRGYGAMFKAWIEDSNMGAYNSWGNGAPMRCSAAGHVATSLEEAYDLAKRSAAVTHSHEQAIKGAQFVAGFIYLIRAGSSKEDAVERLLSDLDHDDKYYRSILSQSLDEMRPTYRFYESSKNTVPQAVRCVLEGASYEDIIRNAISLGGDADTLAAIAGSMAEVLYGIPDEIISKGLERLDDRLRNLVIDFYEFISE